MAKKEKLETPAWITEGYDSPAEYNKAKGIKAEKKKGKTFKVRRCPECNSDSVRLVLSNSDSEEGGGKEWACKKCKWKGGEAKEEELTEDQFMKYLDERGEEVA